MIIILIIVGIPFIIFLEIMPWWLVLLLIPYTTIMYVIGYKAGRGDVS